jgi:rubredoxin
MQFYVIESQSLASNIRTYAGGQWVNSPGIRCPACKVLKEDMGPEEIQIELNYLGRKGFVEVLWNSHLLPIFRQDVIEMWQLAGFTGFEIKPVRIVGWRGKKGPLPDAIPQYYRLVVTSRAALLSPPTLYVCPVCGFRKYDFEQRIGIQVDTSLWDGSDFLELRYYRIVLCTRRVVEATLQAGYGKHIAFVRAEEWDTWEQFNTREWDPKDWQKMIEGFLIRKVEEL